MNVFVRTDASVRIGTGHVMRCIALGKVLREQGAQLIFVMREPPPFVKGVIENQGFGIRLMAEGHPTPDGPQSYESWLGVSWDVDARETRSILRGEGKIDWLIVDHYGIDYRWEESVRTLAGRTLVIDDLARRPHSCDMLLNQNLIANGNERYDALVRDGCSLLLGPQFALLRPEFRAARASLHRKFDNVANLMVFLGGADPDSITEKVLRVIDSIRTDELLVTVVLGAANPHRSAIEALYGSQSGYRVIIQTDNMAQLMVEADAAIGAGGTSTWERCCLGLPSIALAIADNQLEVVHEVAKVGACLYVGPHQQISDEKVAMDIGLLISNPSLRKTISEASLRLVDGLGCDRVSKEMGREPIRVRRARADDAERVFHWRNAEETRRQSHDPSPMSIETHLKWFRQSLADEKRILLIGEIETVPIGVLRYDVLEHVATVSVYLDPSRYGHGYGTALLMEGERWLRSFRPDVSYLRAEIFPVNVASLRAFAKSGFKEHGTSFEKPIRTWV
jgi:UDP-2,4-diacetamido-2,4,6-trideoxy-beta-L-altropyranose hydrolase